MRTPAHRRTKKRQPSGTRTAFRLTAAGLVLGAITVSVSVLPISLAGAAIDTVTNCSGSASTLDSLPYWVQNASSGDTVSLPSSLSACSPITVTSTLDITENLTLSGPGATALAVSGGSAVQVFDVARSVTVAISGLTIEDGTTPGTPGGGNGGNGGGISNAGTLSLSNDLVLDNSTGAGSRGGGPGGNGGDGAGIYNSGTLTLTNATVSGNSTGSGGDGGIMPANGGNGGDGAGIYNSGTLTLTNATVSGNSTGSGGKGNVNSDGGNGGNGAGIFSSGTLSLTNDTVSGNSTGSGGAGVGPGPGTAGNGGKGGNGGGIYSSATLMLSNDTVSGNATGSGGAAGMSGGGDGVPGPAGLGGGISNVGGTVSMTATIVANSTTGADCSGGITDNDYNIADDTSCAFTESNSTNQSLTLDGYLGTLGSNGGPTTTIALEAGSPAIDVVPAADCPATDQRGAPRTPPCDIGAYDTDSAPWTNPDATTTSLSTSPGSEAYGDEGATTFTVIVTTGHHEVLPSSTETVTVDVGTTSCLATLSPDVGVGGQGSCALTNDALLAGSYMANATYGGDSDLAASPNAGTAPFTVTMTLSPSTVPDSSFEVAYPTTTFSAGGANGTVTFSESGPLPQGLSFTAGVLSGTPTSVSQIGLSFPFSVKATDQDLNSITGNYSITVLAHCTGGLTPHLFSATAGTGNFTGLFCVNGSGVGTYQQGAQVGTGTVFANGTRRVTAFGTNIALLGQENGSISTFTETAPAPEKAGTFTLS